MLVYKNDYKNCRLSSQKIQAIEFSITSGENPELNCQIQQLHNCCYSPALMFTASIVGACNGLLCQIIYHSHPISRFEHSICLSNLQLKNSSRILPKRRVVLNDNGRKDIEISFYGFGYDDIHDNYKVVIANRQFDDKSSVNHEYEYDVYNQRSNSWSAVRSYIDFRYHRILDPFIGKGGVLVNCALHWILRNTSSSGNRTWTNSILAFDLRTEKNKIFPLPKAIEGLAFRLNVLDGCLVLLPGSLDRNDQPNKRFNFDLWVMKDYGMTDSWMRITVRNMPYDGYSLTPVAVLEGENKRKLFIFSHCRIGMILSYDLVSHHVQEDAAIAGTYGCRNVRFQFVSSLVQP